jgi:hypothetical protein
VFHEPGLPESKRRTAVKSVSSRTRELAGRASSGMLRLIWNQGTSHLWVEVWGSGSYRARGIPVAPERALNAFRDPYAYAGPHNRPTADWLVSSSAQTVPARTRESHEE